jgi:hypothetical protein
MTLRRRAILDRKDRSKTAKSSDDIVVDVSFQSLSWFFWLTFPTVMASRMVALSHIVFSHDSSKSILMYLCVCPHGMPYEHPPGP